MTAELKLPRLLSPLGAFAMAFSSLLVGVSGSVQAQNLDEETYFALAGDGDFLLMEGTINSNTPQELLGILNSNPQIHTIILGECLGSDDDEANFPMARMVRARGLNTHITDRSQIYSGCVDFFVAGNLRTMERGARVGVHAWSDDQDREATQYPRNSREHELNRKFIEDMLGSDEFYWFTIQAAPSEGMHLMSDEEIAYFNLLRY